ncbi:hypothetical protein PR048_006821 [Dryococelus australis]|uniref:Mutator-like transposase domain-containing protein n=1 Tax=Dryococelus australis TaxID=614101 RepID=A0ABQ9IC41_9NEOP|nr:hypothetical protein PR048_006821 [Dryococelus australis]
MEFKKEIRIGLHCKWTFKCDTCHREFCLENEEADTDVLNNAGTWAALTSGTGVSQSENMLGTLDVPAMNRKTFSKNESFVEKVEKKNLFPAAGKEGRLLAEEKGNVDSDGVPFTTVIVDGGWSKWSYGHNYNASGLVSERTLIYMYINIHYCKLYKKSNVDSDGVPFTTVIVDGGWSKWSYGHNYNASGLAVIIGELTGKLLFLGVRNKHCFLRVLQNWDNNRPSTTMEQDIIVEGFRNIEQMHGLRYKHFVGDLDSTADNTLAVDARKLLKSSIPHLTAVARGAIRHCGCVGEQVSDLVRDLENGPYHVFGQHERCRSYFCNKEEENGTLESIKKSGLLEEVSSLVQRLAAKAPRFI